MLQVQHLPLQLVGFGIHKRHLVRQDRMGDGHAYVPSTNHGYLGVMLSERWRHCLLDGAKQGLMYVIGESEL